MVKKVLLAVFVILLLGGGGMFLYLRDLAGKVLVSPSATMVNLFKPAVTPKPGSQAIDLVLLGYGGGNHDGAYLTDSMMVVHVDPETQRVFLISIPRDIWVKIPTNGTDGSYSKINAAYEYGLDDQDYPNKLDQFKGADGGGRLAEYIVSQVTGLPINNFVGIDFGGFVKTIDALGGVDINVETAFTDTNYPIEGKEDDPCGHADQEVADFPKNASDSGMLAFFPCRYEDLRFDAGTQHMDGATALKYVRSRHSLADGTDFGRAKRQRNLLVAVKNKVLSGGFVTKAIPFMSTLGGDFKTDFTLDQIKNFIGKAGSWGNFQVVTLALTDQNYLADSWSSDNQAILIPKAGLDDWSNVQSWLAAVLAGKTPPALAVVEVLNGTNFSGLAQTAVNRLKTESIQTVAPAAATVASMQQTQVLVYGRSLDPVDLKLLKQEFGVDPVFSDASPSGSFNVRVVLGADYEQKVGVKPTTQP